MKVFVVFNQLGWIKNVYLDKEKAYRELSDGDYIEEWEVV